MTPTPSAHTAGTYQDLQTDAHGQRLRKKRPASALRTTPTLASLRPGRISHGPTRLCWARSVSEDPTGVSLAAPLITWWHNASVGSVAVETLPCPLTGIPGKPGNGPAIGENTCYERCGSFPDSSRTVYFYPQPTNTHILPIPCGRPDFLEELHPLKPSSALVCFLRLLFRVFFRTPLSEGTGDTKGEGEDFTRRVESQRLLCPHRGEHVAFPSRPPVVPGLRNSHDARRRSHGGAMRGHERPPVPPPGSSSGRPRCLEAARTHTMLSTSSLGKKRHVQDRKLHAGEGLCFCRKHRVIADP